MVAEDGLEREVLNSESGVTWCSEEISILSVEDAQVERKKDVEFEDELLETGCLLWKSHGYFLLGGLLYTVAGVWDVVESMRYNSSEDEDDDCDEDCDDEVYISVGGMGSFSLYLAVYTTAALFYVLNALVDFQIARKTKEESVMSAGSPADLSQNHEPASGINSPVANPASSPTKTMVFLTMPSSPRSPPRSPPRSWKHSVSGSKAYLFHLEESVAVIFGTAALFDLLSALLSDAAPESSSLISSVSCHLYLFEAVVALFGRRLLKIPPLHDQADDGSQDPSSTLVYLNQYGDFLFLLGSLIDVATSYCYVLPSIQDSLQLSCWNLASSFLWLVDALLYLAADIIYENSERRDWEFHENELTLMPHKQIPLL